MFVRSSGEWRRDLDGERLPSSLEKKKKAHPFIKNSCGFFRYETDDGPEQVSSGYQPWPEGNPSIFCTCALIHHRQKTCWEKLFWSRLFLTGSRSQTLPCRNYARSASAR